MKKPKNPLELQIVLSATPKPNFRNLVISQNLSALLGKQIVVLVVDFLLANF